MTLPLGDLLLAPPGAGFRFAVGAPDGPKSSVYDIVTAKNKSDVYLTAAALASTKKVSFHESGQWQYSFHSNVAMGFFDHNADRHLERWSPSEPFAPGWRRAFVITVPRTELRAATLDIDAQVRWIEDPGLGYWLNIHIAFRDPGSDTSVTWNNAVTVGGLQMHNGGLVVVVAERYRPTPEQGKVAARYRDFLLHNHRIVERIADSGNPVANLFGTDEDGVRGFTELSLTRPPVGTTPICIGTYAPIPGIEVTFRERKNPRVD